MTKTYPEITGDGEKHLTILKVICGDVENKSMLDLCCGFAPTTQQLGFERSLYVDVVDRPLLEHRTLVISDVFKFLETCNKYDVTILLDAIEHFRINDADRLLNLMELKSDKQVIFTPLGPYMDTSDPEDNHPDHHKSGWYPSNLPGYATLVFPQWHPQLNIGAFYAWKCADVELDFERVIKQLEI